MATSGSSAVRKFLAGLPAEQRRVLRAVREVVLKHLPEGFVERLSGKVINYEVPLERYPKTYNGQPLMYAALAAQKRYYALYVIGAYQDPQLDRTLRDGFEAAGKKLDMGKSCVRFRSLEDLPLDLVGRVIAHNSVADFIAQHEAGRSRAPGRPTRSRAGVPTPKYFKSPEAFGLWLRSHHSSAKELWVGFHKRSTGRPSLTWPESVDEALCYGWIDGIRKTVDETRYTIRFTARRPGSYWSAVNIRRVRALVKEGRMQPSGLEAFKGRHASKSERYSYENRPHDLPPKYFTLLKANEKAWSFYRSQPPWYRRAVTWWIVSATREETRLRRLSTLIEDSAAGRPIPPLSRTQKAK